MKLCSALLLANLALVASSSNAQTVRRVPEDVPSIQAAIDAANTGDTIRVGPGEWAEGLSITGKSSITIEGVDRTTCVLRPVGAINGIWLDSASGCTIRALTLKGDRLLAAGADVSYAGLAAARSYFTIEDLTIERCPEIGISVGQTTKASMSSVEIKGCGESALEIRGDSTVIGSGVTLAESDLGLWAGGGGTSVRLSGSYLTDNRSAGAYLTDGADVAFFSTDVGVTPAPVSKLEYFEHLDLWMPEAVFKIDLLEVPGLTEERVPKAGLFEVPGLPEEGVPKTSLFEDPIIGLPASVFTVSAPKPDSEADGIRVQGAGTKLALDDCSIHDYSASGIVAWADARIVLRRTALRDLGRNGASLSGLGAGSRIEHCEATGNNGDGIRLWDSDGVVIRANTLDRNGSDGLYVEGVTALDARNNTCSANARYGIVAFAPFDGRISENIALDNRGIDVAVGPGLESSPGIMSNRVTQNPAPTPSAPPGYSGPIRFAGTWVPSAGQGSVGAGFPISAVYDPAQGTVAFSITYNYVEFMPTPTTFRDSSREGVFTTGPMPVVDKNFSGDFLNQGEKFGVSVLMGRVDGDRLTGGLSWGDYEMVFNASGGFSLSAVR